MVHTSIQVQGSSLYPPHLIAYRATPTARQPTSSPACVTCVIGFMVTSVCKVSPCCSCPHRRGGGVTLDLRRRWPTSCTILAVAGSLDPAPTMGRKAIELAHRHQDELRVAHNYHDADRFAIPSLCGSQKSLKNRTAVQKSQHAEHDTISMR